MYVQCGMCNVMCDVCNRSAGERERSYAHNLVNPLDAGGNPGEQPAQFVQLFMLDSAQTQYDFSRRNLTTQTLIRNRASSR